MSTTKPKTKLFESTISRRAFLQVTAATITLPHCLAGEKPKSLGEAPLAGEVGITTSSLSEHILPHPTNAKITLLELPRILRDHSVSVTG